MRQAKFGWLTVVSKDAARSSPGRKYVRVTCVCGVQKSIRWDGIQSGAVLSCGCKKATHGLKHGHARTGKSRSPTYVSWDSMWQRCTNPRTPHFADYGGRGITVCRRWRNFELFFKDMGTRPHGCSLERINNQRGYRKSNCTWATRSVQRLNTRRTVRVMFRRKLWALFDLCEQRGVPYKLVYARIKKLGWDVTRAITTPRRGA